MLNTPLARLHCTRAKYGGPRTPLSAQAETTLCVAKPATGARSLCREPVCCVCFLRTEDETPCGHTVCQPCLRALKQPASCPICRRLLPAPSPLDYEELVRGVLGADLSVLQNALRTASSSSTVDAMAAQACISAEIADRIHDTSLHTLSTAATMLPLEGPEVSQAACSRLEALAARVYSLSGLLDFAQRSQPARSAGFALRIALDKAIQEAAQRIVPCLSLEEICTWAAYLGHLQWLPGMDRTILLMNLQEAMLRGLRDDFCRSMAEEFAAAAGALAAQNLLEESQEGYVASVFASRLSCYVTMASAEELFDIEEALLPCLPSSSAWVQAKVAVERSIARRSEFFARRRASEVQEDLPYASRRRPSIQIAAKTAEEIQQSPLPALRKPTSPPGVGQGRLARVVPELGNRLARIEGFVHGMKQIDASLAEKPSPAAERLTLATTAVSAPRRSSIRTPLSASGTPKLTVASGARSSHS